MNKWLDKLCKKDLILIDLSLQNKIEEGNNYKTDLLDEICNLNDKFIQLQSHVYITENVNNLLSSRLVDIKHLYWENAEYSRSECLYITSLIIPKEGKDKTLEESVDRIFDNLGCSIDATKLRHAIR